MNVIVVGGGIGGMAAALALERRGITVTVLEQAPQLSEVGAGLWLTANAVKVLRHLGVEALVRRRAVEVEGQSYLGFDDGRLLMHTALGSQAEQRYGAPSYFVHRADLLAALHSSLVRTEVRLGAQVVEVQRSADSATVRLESGEHLTADLLIGADGLKSVVREHLFGPQDPRFSDRISWRAVFPYERISHVGLEPNRQHCWFGQGRSTVCYPLRNSRLYNFVGFVPTEEMTRESWTLSGDVAGLRDSFRGACPQLTAIVDAIDEAFVTGLHFRNPLASWHADRVTLLGDAAHPTLPTVGQGATMALEDAVTLAACLSTDDGIAAALARYEVPRIARTSRVLEISRANSHIMNLVEPDHVRARDARFKGFQSIDPVGRAMYEWLWGHDAAADAGRTAAGVVRESGGAIHRERPEARRAVDLWRSVLTPEDRAGGWPGERAAYDRFWSSAFPAPSDVRVQQLGTVRGAFVTGPDGDHGPAVLHLHGGGYVMGSAAASLELTTRLARTIDGCVLTPEYRLAPEHAAPAALMDALAAYRWLLDAGRRSEDIVLFGECAGGGLAIALAVAAKEAGLPQPGGIHVVSPLCDLTLNAHSIDASKGDDPWLDRERLTWMAASNIQTNDPRDWRISPIHADLSGLAPILIHYAADEAVADDAVMMAERARAAGVDVTLLRVEDSVHSFVLFPFLPEAGAALEQTARFLGRTRDLLPLSADDE